MTHWTSNHSVLFCFATTDALPLGTSFSSATRLRPASPAICAGMCRSTFSGRCQIPNTTIYCFPPARRPGTQPQQHHFRARIANVVSGPMTLVNSPTPYGYESAPSRTRRWMLSGHDQVALSECRASSQAARSMFAQLGHWQRVSKPAPRLLDISVDSGEKSVYGRAC